MKYVRVKQVSDDSLSTGNGLIDLLCAPVFGPMRAIIWMARKIEEQAEGEMLDEDRVKSDLLELQMHLEMDEITEEEYDEQEGILLERLNSIRELKEERAGQ